MLWKDGTGSDTAIAPLLDLESKHVFFHKGFSTRNKYKWLVLDH